MDNHFHLLVQTTPENEISDTEVEEQFGIYYKEKFVFSKGEISRFKRKCSNLYKNNLKSSNNCIYIMS